MTTRRNFIKVLAAVPPACTFRQSWAAADPTRLALVIGNSAYRDAPLLNPGNDARAMAGLFVQAGFTVDSHLDATRTVMVTAIERFGAAIRRPETRQVVFYYAGHGVQLDWRNYLAPIDAEVDTADQLRMHCVDLGLLLSQLGAAKDKTFIIILDACRDNPFGSAYRPEQKGLAQFDAPVGSLLAYATSPGKGAADGSGKNGLYTESLVRELSRRDTRIEDALKRVRLNVRLASQGRQIPWETTSLESDVFLFNDGQKKLTEAELEKQVEADIAEWERIKSSRKLNDWVAYLRTFPNGRFAEIAQMRLARLLAEVEKLAAEKRQREEQQRLAEEQKRLAEEQQRLEAKNRLEQEKQALARSEKLASVKPAPIQATSATPAPPTVAPSPTSTPLAKPAAEDTRASAAPMINLRAGVAVPTLIAPSANPFSAGRYPNSRIYTVGDEATFRESDALTGVEQRTYTLRVTRVDYDLDRVEINDGQHITDLMGNSIKEGGKKYASPRQWTPAEYQVGRKWTATLSFTYKQGTKNAYHNLQIVKRETITVPAGTFDTFRIEGEGMNVTEGNRVEMIMWLVPGLNFPVKREFISRPREGGFGITSRSELISLRQQIIDTECAITSDGLQGTLAIKSQCT